MKKFKNRWEINKNWQLIIPFLGVISLLYSAYRVAGIFFDRHEKSNLVYLVLASIVLYFIFLKVTFFFFKKLERRWVVKQKYEMISLFLVFAFTGSSSMFIGRPIIKMIGITEDNLNITVYWILYILIGLLFYQVLLVLFGWLFGQFTFFWNFEKKILSRFGFKNLK